MIDFSDCPKTGKTYSGANGQKIQINYMGENYMLKFPSNAKHNKNMTYSNSSLSEYIGCHIFEQVGIPVQETLLGKYKIHDKEKIVVACKDFVPNNYQLQDLISVKNQIIDSERNGAGTDLQEIEQTIQQQDGINPEEMTKRFWDMFIVDAIIGNWDRHNGNWGILYNFDTQEKELAPIYDCGSSLYPQADSSVKQEIMNFEGFRNDKIYNGPLSAICENGHKINYFEFISSCKNPDCNKALIEISKRIDTTRIDKMIDEIDCIDNDDKKFYKLIISERITKIIDFSLKKLYSREIELLQTSFSENKADMTLKIENAQIIITPNHQYRDCLFSMKLNPENHILNPMVNEKLISLEELKRDHDKLYKMLDTAQKIVSGKRVCIDHNLER